MGNLTITPERLKQVDFTGASPARNVVEIAVAGPGAEPRRNGGGLARGRKSTSRKSSSYYQRHPDVNAELAKAKKAQVKGPAGARESRRTRTSSRW